MRAARILKIDGDSKVITPNNEVFIIKRDQAKILFDDDFLKEIFERLQPNREYYNYIVNYGIPIPKRKSYNVPDVLNVIMCLKEIYNKIKRKAKEGDFRSVTTYSNYIFIVQAVGGIRNYDKLFELIRSDIKRGV